MDNRLRSKLVMSAMMLSFWITAMGAAGLYGQTRQSAVAGSVAVTSPSAAMSNDTDAIEKIVRNYLLKNPSVIREAMQALQAQEMKEKQERAANLMKELRNEIFFDPYSPVSGNASGDVSIVVFFDYNCGYCKQTLPQLQNISKKDPLVRIVYKEFPVLGPRSTFAAKVAASRQGKFVEFHNALMTAKSTDEESIKSISKTLGIDYSKLQKDMADPQIEEQITRTQRLAESLDINGTPAYIIGDRIIPGAIDAESLTSILVAERQVLTKAAAKVASKER